MKRRFLSLLLALVMLVGMIPATAMTAEAASTEVIGIEVTGNGYKYANGVYTPNVERAKLLTTYGWISGGFSIITGAFYSDEDFYHVLTTEPELGETYYFFLRLYYSDMANSITNAISSIKLNGFSRAEFSQQRPYPMGLLMFTSPSCTAN